MSKLLTGLRTMLSCLLYNHECVLLLEHQPKSNTFFMNAQDIKTVKLVINSDQVQQKLDDINKKPSSRPQNTSKLKVNLEIHKSSDDFI